MAFITKYTALFILALPFALVACDDGGGGEGGTAGNAGSAGSTSTGGSGGSAGGTTTGGSGGSAGSTTTGTGGAPMSLVDSGFIENACAPNDGPAIEAQIGVTTACGAALAAEPIARFYFYPGDLASAKAGDKWVSGGNPDLSVTFMPTGPMGAMDAATGEIEFVTIDAMSVTVKYAFQTATESYAGTVTLDICEKTDICG
ncbi:MAG: hypothetical protein IPK82_25910 [Polyangiaceae bacterium]|nr:hypothetical protein [Polyangiaceae bacterium]